MNRLNKEAHIVEEINGIRCSVVEKDCNSQRVDFLKKLLEYNGYKVESGPMPPPKPKPAKPAAEGEENKPEEIPPPPQSFMVGVTDVLFHPMLAVYERSLNTPSGKPVTIAYWNEQPDEHGEIYWLSNS